MAAVLPQGTRVDVLYGGQLLPGSVNYVRLAPPAFAEPEVYSVLLDERLTEPGYAGSIFKAAQVHPAEQGEPGEPKHCPHGQGFNCPECWPS